MEELKWDDLRVFLAVAREGTLAAAAADLGINASTVHRRVASLEAQLDAELFERDPRGYALTSVGEALLPRAEEVAEAVLRLRRTATGHDRTAQGPVTITMPADLVRLVAPQLAEIKAEAPGLRPILRADDHMLDLGADADVALRPSSKPPARAVGRRLGKIAMAVYASARSRKVLTLPWVTYVPGRGPDAASRWRRKVHPGVPIQLELSSVSAMHQVLTCTRTQGLLPCYLGDADRRLRRVSEPIEEAATDLWLLIHADLRRSARVRALVDLLVPRLEELRPLLAGERAD